MTCKRLIQVGTIGAVIAAVCCTTPVLGILLGALGLGAWLIYSDYVILPMLVACVAIAAFGYYRLRSGSSA
jgi:mercuric ion transport protein